MVGPPPTLLECFDEEHPHYLTERKAEMQARIASPSSQITYDQPPPRILIFEPVDTWLHEAHIFLRSRRARENDQLNDGRIPLTEPCSIATEQDVVKLSTLYIIHPVMIAIQARFPGSLTQFSESPAKPMRIDLTFNSLSRFAAKRVVMIMEYKRCWYIHEEEFFDAMCYNEDEIDEALDKLEYYGEESTLIKGTNAYWFVKQITAYVVATGCRYVALCDYEHLILIRFNCFRLETAEVTVVPRHCFRKALLGFMFAACMAAGMIIG
ncbi:hypothetical protein FB567DRAFT_588113 [Paraphoma chrysanthemicola]|uniref:Uncharacterized protein n=1 Tax=Paraphoma chrysanthemicola TaxID=798071 RepID=A0A8K0W311_9PLEO|nr:hypothetical protein FB567DRAFT_588113 [Paraphoma chrysanthemicola]